ncbi:MAG TPA: hypothetical protein VFV34_08960, partial [Blastocatellia bacterium]|nr:hypothetical protein [Blastocatellia bacterium]
MHRSCRSTAALQPKAIGQGSKLGANAGRATVQRSHSAIAGVRGVVQAAIRLYPNLHPGAYVQVDQELIFKLSSFADHYRLERYGSHNAQIPNLRYNFVTTRDGALLLHNRFRHPSLAGGQQVL